MLTNIVVGESESGGCSLGMGLGDECNRGSEDISVLERDPRHRQSSNGVLDNWVNHSTVADDLLQFMQ